MSKPENYRARAAQCGHMAERNRDPTLKAQYLELDLELARQWRELAQQAEEDEAEKGLAE